MSNYLRAGVSTYGYDSFRLTTAINRGARDQNCSSESVTDDRYGKRFSMIFLRARRGGLQGTDGGGKKRGGKYRMKMKKKKKNEEKKKSKKDFFPHEVVQHKKWQKKQKLPTFNNVSDQLWIAEQRVWWDDAACDR